MTKPVELVAYVFDDEPHLLSAELLDWMQASPRFAGFVDTYRDKIRKKVRITSSPENVLDLRSELLVACRLLDDRRITLVYEPFASERRRGPDFTATYRANLDFNIEVARIRPDGSAGSQTLRSPVEERILRVLLDKLGQMQPGMANLLVFHAGQQLAEPPDLAGLLQTVKSRADAKDPGFYAASRRAGPAAFYRDFQRLSGILLCTSSTQVWSNRQARQPLPDKVLRLVSALLSEQETTD